MADKTVTLSDQDWQQLTAIIANATGYLAFQRLVQQLQSQEAAQVPQGMQRKGDGLDPDPGELPANLRRVPRTMVRDSDEH